jgi:hypothetical protein
MMAPVLRIGYAVASVGHVSRHGGGDGGENEERSEMHGAAEMLRSLPGLFAYEGAEVVAVKGDAVKVRTCPIVTGRCSEETAFMKADDAAWGKGDSSGARPRAQLLVVRFMISSRRTNWANASLDFVACADHIHSYTYKHNK